MKGRHIRLVRWALFAVTLIVAGFFLAPKTSEALEAVRHLRTVHPAWIALALAAEITSLLAFSAVTYLLIERGCRPVLRRVVRVDLVTVALSHAVPAGSAAGTALGYQLLADEGTGPVQSGFTKVTQSLISGLMLQCMLWGSLALAALFARPSDPYIGLAAVGAFVTVMLLIFAWLLARREPLVRRVAVRALCWLPRLDPERIGGYVDGLSERMHRLARHPGTLAWVCLWSFGNWAFDALSLWASLRAFGYSGGMIELTLAFAVGQVAASLPITPGGLGIVEASLVPLLIGLGTGSSVAVLGVLTWRLFNYWLPLPVGGAAYLFIAADRRRHGGSVQPVLAYRNLTDREGCVGVKPSS